MKKVLVSISIGLIPYLLYSLDTSPSRVSVRHVEPEGIGYNQGYSTIEGFISPNHLWKQVWKPFIDTRFHVFNNANIALNEGIGLRYLTDSRVWGVNTYYDYRKTSHQHYNQMGVGLESLGKIWDIRLNGYLPMGKKTSSVYGRKFEEFQGHYAYASSKYQFALKGISAEGGFHIESIEKVPIYVTAGPYYLTGKNKSAWGGEIRACFNILDYLQIEGNTSYDRLFGWIGQGQIGITVPLGKRRNSNKSTSKVFDRSVQKVFRHEIIPIYVQHEQDVMINTATNSPYVFWFVDNTSHSAGTWESPFPTLTEAQNASSPNDVIYVLPGNRSSEGMDLGIVLKDNQYLFGSGIAHTLATSEGNVTIPAQSAVLPQISNSANLSASVITLASNNQVAGLEVIGETGGTADLIIGSGITNATIFQNNIHASEYGVVGESVSAIRFFDNENLGTVSISDCTIDITGAQSFEYLEGTEVSAVRCDGNDRVELLNLESNIIHVVGGSATIYSGAPCYGVLVTENEGSCAAYLASNTLDVFGGSADVEGGGSAWGIVFSGSAAGSLTTEKNIVFVTGGQGVGSGGSAFGVSVEENYEDVTVSLRKDIIQATGGSSSAFAGDAYGVYIKGNDEQVFLTMQQEQVGAIGGFPQERFAGTATGLDFYLNHGQLYLDIKDNIIYSCSGSLDTGYPDNAYGVFFHNNLMGIDLTLSNNEVTTVAGNTSAHGMGVAMGFLLPSDQILNLDIENNTFNAQGNASSIGVHVVTVTETSCVNLVNNIVMDNQATTDYSIEVIENEGRIDLYSQGNVGSIMLEGNVVPLDAPCQ